jgi:KDO2-lipid IV(A) lauroyltransferase
MNFSFIEFFLLRTLLFVLRLLPYRKISDTGALAGMIFELFGIRKKTAIQNILQSDLNQSSIKAKEIISESYRNFGRTFFELLDLDRIRLAEGKDFELVLPEKFYDDINKGAIFVSAHIGNWELMGKVLASKGIPLAVVVKRQYNDRVDRLISRLRKKVGMVVVYDDEPLKLLRLIEDRHCIALLADQDFGDNPVPVHFMGRECYAQEGPVYFARRFNLPVFFCFALRRNKYFHHFEIQRMKMDFSKNNETLVQHYTDAIEKIIRIDPSQWLWHHRRWKVHA